MPVMIVAGGGILLTSGGKIAADRSCCCEPIQPCLNSAMAACGSLKMETPWGEINPLTVGHVTGFTFWTGILPLPDAPCYDPIGQAPRLEATVFCPDDGSALAMSLTFFTGSAFPTSPITWTDFPATLGACPPGSAELTFFDGNTARWHCIRDDVITPIGCDGSTSDWPPGSNPMDCSTDENIQLTNNSWAYALLGGDFDLVVSCA